MKTPYDDILALPHHVSTSRPRMSMHDRAAQFSPFAALTGYEAVISETARPTGRRVELEDDGKQAINLRLQMIGEHIGEQPEIAVTYFAPDEKKVGGNYVTRTGHVKKIDAYRRVVVMADGTEVPLDEIIQLQGELLRDIDLP